MHEIFISYSSKDQYIADAIINILESRRIKCWIAYVPFGRFRAACPFES